MICRTMRRWRIRRSSASGAEEGGVCVQTLLFLVSFSYRIVCRMGCKQGALLSFSPRRFDFHGVRSALPFFRFLPPSLASSLSLTVAMFYRRSRAGSASASSDVDPRAEISSAHQDFSRAAKMGRDGARDEWRVMTTREGRREVRERAEEATREDWARLKGRVRFFSPILPCLCQSDTEGCARRCTTRRRRHSAGRPSVRRFSCLPPFPVFSPPLIDVPFPSQHPIIFLHQLPPPPPPPQNQPPQNQPHFTDSHSLGVRPREAFVTSQPHKREAEHRAHPRGSRQGKVPLYDHSNSGDWVARPRDRVRRLPSLNGEERLTFPRRSSSTVRDETLATRRRRTRVATRMRYAAKLLSSSRHNVDAAI